MKILFVPMEEARSTVDAEELCLWACVVVPVDGGFMAFESYDDLQTWQNQL